MSEPTKVILAGAGFMGKAHANGYQAIDDAQLVCVVDPFEPGKELAAELNIPHVTSLKSALEEFEADMVDVCVPTFLHEEYVLTALDAHKAVLCEKPFALNSESARTMRDAAVERGVPLMIAQPLRFWPEYIKVVEALRSGELGETIMTTAVRLSQPPAWAEWYNDPTLSGGGALDLHAHDIDMLVHLHGKVESVYAVGHKNQDGAWNHVVSSLTFANGQKGVVEGGLDMSNGYPFSMGLRVLGSKGTIDFFFKAGANLDEVVENEPTLWRYHQDSEPEIVDFVPKDAYTREIEYFVSQLRAGKPTDMVPIDESVHILDTLMAIRRSLESGLVEKLEN